MGQAFEEAESAHGPVTVLVANAGTIEDRLLVRMTEADFTPVLDTNLTGAFRVARRAVRGMLRTGHGRVVLISSTSALHGAPEQSNHAAAKAGLLASQGGHRPRSSTLGTSPAMWWRPA